MVMMICRFHRVLLMMHMILVHMNLLLPGLNKVLIHHLSSMKRITKTILIFHHHLSSMIRSMPSILQIFLRHLIHFLLPVTLLTINPIRKSPNETFIHHFLETYLKTPHTLNHTTLNPINKISNHICQLITHHPMKLPLTHTLISSHIQISQRVVYLQSRLTIRRSIKAPRLLTVPIQLLLRQTIRQQLNTLPVAETGKSRNLHQLLLKNTNMTAITNHHLRRSSRHTRQLGSRLVL